MSEFEGKVAIVTGASSGIGRATAEMLAVRGAKVAVCARSAERLEELRALHPGEIVILAGDVGDLATIDRLFSLAESRFGPVDIVVNNAGMVEVANLTDATLDHWNRTFHVNVTAVFLACRRALPSMIRRGSGSIVNVSSISGVPGPEKFPGFTAYCASKAAVIALTEALAVEVKRSGVRVNAVSPGSVDTPMWTEVSGGAPAAMTPAEVAEAILFLASARSLPMNGQNLCLYSS